MRILTITNLYPNSAEPTRGVFNLHQVEALSKGHAVSVIAPVAWTDECRLIRGGHTVLRSEVRAGVPAEHPRYVFPPRVLRDSYGAWYRASVRPAFRRAVGRLRPDVVLAAWAYPDGWAAVELAHEAGLPAVVKVHGSDVLMLSRYPERVRRTGEALCRADRVIAVSRNLADHVAALGVAPERIDVVYDGVDARLFRPGERTAARRRLGLAPDGHMILYVGNLLPVKGPDVLVEACSALQSNGARFSCHLVGGGPMAAGLQRQIDTRGLKGCVHLQGRRPHDDLPDWYRAADVVVLPSRSEGVPCVLLEAAACRRPVVACGVGGVPEVAHLTATRLVPSDDPARLAAALADTLAENGPAGRDTPSGATEPVRGHDEAAADLVAVLRQAVRTHRRASPDVERIIPLTSRGRTSQAVAPPAVLAEEPASRRPCRCTACPRPANCQRRHTAHAPSDRGEAAQ